MSYDLEFLIVFMGVPVFKIWRCIDNTEPNQRVSSHENSNFELVISEKLLIANPAMIIKQRSALKVLSRSTALHLPLAAAFVPKGGS